MVIKNLYIKRWLIYVVVALLLLTSCSNGKSPVETTPSPTPASVENSGNTDDTQNGDTIDITKIDPNVVNPSPLTGLEMNGDYKPVAIMIENFKAARPQSGIIDADLVYEANVEGGITRFLAIFQSKRPEKVGPVRSLRHYFMWLAQEWDAYLVHYGQSFIAEEYFDKIDVKRLNGFYTDKPFWRDTTRKAPHNVYIDPATCLDKIDYKQEAQGFLFDVTKIPDGSPYTDITIPYYKTITIVTYKYDQKKKLNLRSINGKPDVDRETGNQLFAKNIIIQYAKHSILEPGAGYRDVKLIDKGEAQFFINGSYIEGTWERKGADTKTVYYDDNNNEMYFAPGNTWVQIVQKDMNVTVK